MSGAGISREGERRILIVEDDLELAGLLRATLEKKDYVVDVAGDAVTAEEKVAGTRPSLLLLDLCLPPLNRPECGLELLRRCVGTYPATKVIVLTGSIAPAGFKSSDAVFNIGCAVAAVQSLPKGVYIAMNGRIFDPKRVRKNLKTNRFEDI